MHVAPREAAVGIAGLMDVTGRTEAWKDGITMPWEKLAWLVGYAVFLGFISVYSRSKANDLNKFVLGGRSVGPWMSAFAYGTAYFSAVIFIGYAGRLGWSFGVAATWIGVGNALIGNLLAWKVLGNRTREMTRRLKAYTMPELLGKRYDSRALKIVTSCVIFVFLVPYSASVYQGLAYLFENVMGLPFEWSMVVMACLTGLYLLVGGYIATTLSDFIQGIIMLAGVGVILFCIISRAGGMGAAMTELGSIDGGVYTSVTGPDVWGLISLVIMTSLGSWGLPQMVHKFYAIKDERAVKRGTIISTLFAVVVAGGAYFSGTFGRVILGNVPPMTNGVVDLDMVMPTILVEAVPSALIGLIVVLVLAASMSTLTSVVLASSSTIALDLVKGEIKPDMSQKSSQTLLRALCALFIALSLVLAFNKNTAILTLMSFSWGTVAGVLLPPYLYGLYWKGATRAGAWASVITGLGVSMISAAVLGFDASSAPKIGACAILASLAVMPVVSLLTKDARSAAGLPDAERAS